MAENSWDRELKNPSSIELIKFYSAQIYEYYDPKDEFYSEHVLNKIYPITILDLDQATFKDKSENKSLLESILIKPMYYCGIIETAIPIDSFKNFPYNIEKYVGDIIRSHFDIVIYKENGIKKIEAWPLRVFYDEEFRLELIRKDFIKTLQRRINTLEK